MKVLVLSVLLSLSAGTTFAQTEEVTEEEMVVVEGEEMGAETSGPLAELGELPQLFKDSLACELLGPSSQYENYPPYDKHDVTCSPENDGDTAMLGTYNGGVNYGLIERLNAAGFNTNTWRVLLSDPANLTQFETESADSLSAVIEIATAGINSSRNDDGSVTSWRAQDRALELLQNFENGLETTQFWSYHGKRFIERRQAEALPEHREEIAEIWKRIMTEQIERYLAARN